MIKSDEILWIILSFYAGLNILLNPVCNLTIIWTIRGLESKIIWIMI